MEHQLFIDDDNIITVVYSGALMDQDNLTLVNKLVTISDQFRSEGKKVRGLFDLTNLETQDKNVERLNSLAARDIDFDKVAVFGMNQNNADYTNNIIEKSGKQDRMKIFADKQEALQWLQTD